MNRIDHRDHHFVAQAHEEENHPLGLSLGEQISATKARKAARLPAFGSLCSAAAKLLGLPPLVFASRGQKPWIEAAANTLAAMAERGAPVGQYAFLVADERRAMALLDAAVGLYRGDCNLMPSSFLGNRETRWREASGEKIRRFEGSILQDASADEAFDSLLVHFGDPARARIHCVAHEFAHAWQSAANFPVHAAAVRGVNGLLSLSLRARRARLAQWSPGPPGKGETRAGEILFRNIEESVCDAIGCWAVQSVHGRDALREAKAYRDRMLPACGRRYDTGWLLGLLADQHPEGLPATFQGMVDSIIQCVQRASPTLLSDYDSSLLTPTPSGPTPRRRPT